MAARRRRITAAAMASRWRRRSMCVLLADTPSPAMLRHVSAVGAFLETNVRPELGSEVELHHPEAGAIRGHVVGHSPEGIDLRFASDAPAVSFALFAIAADMTREPVE